MASARPDAIAVFDVGKTNVRLSAVDDDARTLLTLERANSVIDSPPYPHFDADGLYAWLLDGLKQLSRNYFIHTLVPVTHGACAALIDDAGLVLPIMDYEFRSVDEFDDAYDSAARNFADTASPKLPAGLNLGRQLFWQQRKFPDEFGRATMLPYPQYWAWRLSGVRAWEQTSLGCHTDLWSPLRQDFSAFAKKMGWDTQMGQRVSAWTQIGPPLQQVCAVTGLTADTKILAGIHDSNASYLAHRATRDEPFCVVSTGTWIVIMSHGTPLDVLREEADTLANVDAYGNPVATARFMGGREYAAICGEGAIAGQPSRNDLAAVIASGVLAVPSFADEGGPFRNRKGRIVGAEPRTDAHRAALAAMYSALMTDYCAAMLQSTGDVIVEGRLAANEAYTSALAALRAPQAVFRSEDESGTVRGAVALVRMAAGREADRAKVSLCEARDVEEMRKVRMRWRKLVDSE